jgi:hypothetical protein
MVVIYAKTKGDVATSIGSTAIQDSPNSLPNLLLHLHHYDNEHYHQHLEVEGVLKP